MDITFAAWCEVNKETYILWSDWNSDFLILEFGILESGFCVFWIWGFWVLESGIPGPFLASQHTALH